MTAALLLTCESRVHGCPSFRCVCPLVPAFWLLRFCVLYAGDLPPVIESLPAYGSIVRL